MKSLHVYIIMAAMLAAAVGAQMGVVGRRGLLGIKNPIYRKNIDEVSRAEYVTSFGMYLPKGELAVAASAFLGGLRADAYWLKAAQYVSESFEDPALKTRFLGDLYLAMINVDPYWSTAAETAANAIAVVSRENEQAIAVLDRAIRARPDKWRLWYTKMAIYLFWPGHKSDAIRAALAGARTPGASHALRDAANQLATEDGNYKLAVHIAEKRLDRYGINTGLGRIAWRDLLEHSARYYEHIFRKAISDFHKKNGRWPANLQELASSGFMKAVPPEPYELNWFYDPDTGEVISEGLGILEGARMRIILTSLITSYRNRYGRFPEDLQEMMEAASPAIKAPESLRLFGSPPSLREHPLLGDWPYDPETGEITLPPGYTVRFIFDRAYKLLGNTGTQ